MSLGQFRPIFWKFQDLLLFYENKTPERFQSGRTFAQTLKKFWTSIFLAKLWKKNASFHAKLNIASRFDRIDSAVQPCFI